MYSKIKRFSLLLLCGQFLLSCSVPPPKPSKSAMELANEHLETESPMAEEVINDNAANNSGAIPTLTPEKNKPLKQINQVGKVPKVRALTEDSPEIDLPPGNNLQFTFEQMELRQLIQTLADMLGIHFVYDTAIGGERITIRTAEGKSLQREDLWPLLQLILQDAGIIMQKKGGVYHLKKIGQGLPGTIGMPSRRLERSEAPEILQITPLTYISADSAVAAITPLVQPQGRVLTLSNLNILGIITTPQRLERVNRLLEVIDTNPFVHRGMRLFRLSNAKATEVQAELDQIMQAISGNVPAYQVIALERINSVLVIAPPGGRFREVELWVEILDEERNESLEQVFIYRVKNLEATELAATLTDVFKQEDRDEELPAEQETPEEEPRFQVIDGEITFDEQPEQAPPATTKPTGNIPISAELDVTIVADEKTNSLLVRSSARDYRQLLETIRVLDRVPQEVMVNVVIAEVTLTETTKYGIDWTALINKSSVDNEGNTQQSYIGTKFGVGREAGVVLEYFSGDVTSILNLVDSEGNVTLLSRPSILVRNNEEATINVGSNEPIITQMNSNAFNPNTAAGYVSNQVQYRDTGITLKVTPRINDDGIINMKLYQEVSQLGDERTEQRLQSFLQRKIETSVVVRDGSAIIIGGLIENRGNYSNSGIPGLRKIPGISGFFSSTSEVDVRTELVLIIVPRIVNPEINNNPLLQNFRQKMKLINQLFRESDYLPIFSENEQSPEN